MVVPLTAPGAGLATAATIELYRQMLIIRRTEEQLARAHQQGLVHGAAAAYYGRYDCPFSRTEARPMAARRSSGPPDAEPPGPATEATSARTPSAESQKPIAGSR